ncbi:MAG: glycerophosphodiester phosphodiesterase family protein [Sphingomicrobium sp.]
MAPPALGFAHRGLHGADIPENSRAAYRAAIALGAGIECDVRLSRDDVPMLFHDADLKRLCDERGSVETLSAASLAGKRLLGTRETVPRLADLLLIAGGSVPLLIELKTIGNAERLAAAVCRTLGPRPGPVGVMSFDPRVALWLARHRPDVRRGLIIAGDESPIRRWGKTMVARPHFLALDKALLDELRSRLPRYGWTIRTPAERAAATPLADALIWENDGRP